jgi:hypothetical protein
VQSQYKLHSYFANQIVNTRYSPAAHLLSLLLSAFSLLINRRRSYYRLISRAQNATTSPSLNNDKSSIAFAFTKNQQAALSHAFAETKIDDSIALCSTTFFRCFLKWPLLATFSNVLDSFNIIHKHACQSQGLAWQCLQWSLKESLFFSLVLNCSRSFTKIYIFSDQHFFFHFYRSITRTKSFLVFQHAPLGTPPPPPSFDYYYLFSEDSRSKYFTSYPQTTMYYSIIGDSLAKNIWTELRSKPNCLLDNSQLIVNCILICPNLHDSLNEIIDLGFFLSTETQYHVTIRPHPADNRFNVSKLSRLPLLISNQTPLPSALIRNKIVIANESSILLYAMLASCLVYKYTQLSQSNQVNDIYGFMKNGLIIKEYDNTKTLIDDINERVCTYNASMLEYYLGFNPQ